MTARSLFLFSFLFFAFACLVPLQAVAADSADPAKQDIVAPVLPDGEYVPVDDDAPVLIRENPEIESLRKQIESREAHIRAAEEEIQGINRELGQIYRKKDTLERELSDLSLTSRKNEAQIRVTEDVIHRRHLNLRSLDASIGDNTENVRVLRDVLRKNYRRVNEFDLRGTDTLLFLHASFFDLLRHIESSDRYSKALRGHLEMLESETRKMRQNKEEVIVERLALQKQQKELEDRRRIYNFSIARKRSLVKQTKNNEAAYQKMLRDKQRERLELQQELYEYESRIEYLYDPTSVPPPRQGLLRMPYTISAPVTQEFGETVFARANSLKYGRPFHDGIDFGIPSGTRLLASADGIVVGTGNTDLVSSCQSWGKWVLIKHGFGLSTLYAHLSLVKVRVGQKVRSGGLIGYSGRTGFSTGPHLHFGVYDSSGIRVVPYEKVSASARCRGLQVPVAAQDAKLDPRGYLPL